MREIDVMAQKAKTDRETMNALILQNEHFILKCASAAVRSYVSRSDDEWSVALGAFTEAIESYSIDKGSFLNFSELVIRRRIIDFIRSQSRHSVEIPINPSLFDVDSCEEEDGASIKSEIGEKTAEHADNSLKLEIELANEVLSSYGFTFFDLAECSPKAKKTKKSCAMGVAYIINNPILVSNMKVKKLLPIGLIEKNTKIPRKILERHRKYIIAAVEIMTGDYPHLAEYMPFIKEELVK